MANNLAQLKNYFSTVERPVTTAEMSEFWTSLTEAEKDYFRNADIS